MDMQRGFGKVKKVTKIKSRNTTIGSKRLTFSLDGHLISGLF